MKRILYVEERRDETVGGSHTCLLSMAARLDRRLRRKTGQKSQESVIQKFSISNTVHRIEEAYEEIYRK